MTKRKACDWCGCDLRGRETCPRGTCETEKQQHEDLLERIKESDAARR